MNTSIFVIVGLIIPLLLDMLKMSVTLLFRENKEKYKIFIKNFGFSKLIIFFIKNFSHIFEQNINLKNKIFGLRTYKREY